LIAARKVNGTTVYNTEGEKLGRVYLVAQQHFLAVTVAAAMPSRRGQSGRPTILFFRMTGFLRHEGDKTQCQRIAI
jgi:hypothetical protein